MHPERPADGGDPDQTADELGQFLGQHPELVHDHHQPGQPPSPRSAGADLPGEVPAVVPVDVGRAGRGENPLPPAQFGGQRGQRSTGEVRIEVGDDAADVR